MDYLYIDESGDLGKDSKYFIISGILIKKSPKPLEKIVKKARKKYKKEIKESNELKATKSSKKLNKFIMSNLNETDSEIFSIILKKQNMYKLSKKEDKNLIYDILASKIANFLIINNHLEIRVDLSKTNKKAINAFNELFFKNLDKNNYKIKIYHSYSHSYRGLQVADCIAWSYFQLYEYENEEYIKLLELKKTEKKL
jgi:hypothetical protein